MRPLYQRRSEILCALLIVAMPIGGRIAAGSTVVSMSVARMSDYAAQVIVADIGQSTSAWAKNPRRIETTVELLNIEYLKGGYDGAPTQRTLIVPGGKVGTMQMRICGAPEFKSGERWVLFLLPDYKTFPTVGIAQGSFRIADDAGVARVYQGGNLPVADIDEHTWIKSVGSTAIQSHAQPVGATPNIRVEDHSNGPATNAMTFDAFRAAIQPILDKSRDHMLTRPAGQRIPVVYRPVPIRRAAGDAAASGQKKTRGAGTPPREATSQSKRGAARTSTSASTATIKPGRPTRSKTPVGSRPTLDKGAVHE